MRSVIETGARFLLDPRVKHEPTLLSAIAPPPDRLLQVRRSTAPPNWEAIACRSGRAVGDWSIFRREVASANNADRKHGPVPFAPPASDGRLVEGLREVLDYAAAKNVLIGFEPEPGMLIDSMPAFEELLARIDAPNLRLTLDIGHLQCQGETPIADVIRRWAPRLVNVHIEDMRRGVHEHLMFGEGEIDFPPVLRALGRSRLHRRRLRRTQPPQPRRADGGAKGV